jgi:hypothetical protein
MPRLFFQKRRKSIPGGFDENIHVFDNFEKGRRHASAASVQGVVALRLPTDFEISSSKLDMQ